MDPATGAETVVSVGGNFHTPTDVAVLADGSIIVSDANCCLPKDKYGYGHGGLIKVNPATGAETVLSQGGTFRTPNSVAVAPSRLSIANAIALAGVGLKFKVKLSAIEDRPVSMRYTTVNRTAVAGQDYVAASGTLTFAPGGPLTQTIEVQTLGDSSRFSEPTETFAVTLSDPVNAVIADGEAVGTIVGTGPGGLPAPTAELAVSQTAAPDTVRVGDELTYTLRVTNLGASAAVAVTLVDTLPDDAAFVSAAACRHADGTVACDLGDLAAGAVATATIVVGPTAAGTLTTTARVGADEADSDPANNQVPVSTTVTP